MKYAIWDSTSGHQNAEILEWHLIMPTLKTFKKWNFILNLNQELNYGSNLKQTNILPLQKIKIKEKNIMPVGYKKYIFKYIYLSTQTKKYNNLYGTVHLSLSSPLFSQSHDVVVTVQD